MAIARAQLVDVALTRWYHCVMRCVRRAFLLGEGDHNRKQWLQNRLEELAEIFAVSVGGFSVFFSRGASRAWRFSMKKRCWRSVSTLI
jgi:putative transposase